MEHQAVGGLTTKKPSRRPFRRSNGTFAHSTRKHVTGRLDTRARPACHSGGLQADTDGPSKQLRLPGRRGLTPNKGRREGCPDDYG